MVDTSTIIGRPAQASIPLIWFYALPVLHRQTNHTPALLMRSPTDRCHKTTIAACHNDKTCSCKQFTQFVCLHPPFVIFCKPRGTHHANLGLELCSWFLFIHCYLLTHAVSPCVIRWIVS